jgi:hypothetical protein
MPTIGLYVWVLLEGKLSPKFVFVQG